MDYEQKKKYDLILQLLDTAGRLTDAGYGKVRFVPYEGGKDGKNEKQGATEIAQCADK